MRVIEVIEAWGHENIRATHKTAFEVTKDAWLTKRGGCIIAIKASKGALDLDQRFKEAAKKKGAKITVTIEAKDYKETAIGSGDPNLTFKDPKDLVARKSNYTCDRTLMIKSDKAACDLSHDLIKTLQNPRQKIRIILTVET